MRLVLFTLLVVGCSSSTPEKVSADRNHSADDAGIPAKDGEAQPATDALPPDPGVACYSSLTGTAPECASLQLCVTSTPRIQVDPQNCDTAGPCAWTYQRNAGDTLTYENPRGWVFLRFDPGALAGVRDTAGLVAAFQQVNFYAKFPQRDLPSRPTYFDLRTDLAGIDIFEMTGDRVRVKVTFTIDKPSIHILSKTAFCGDTNSCPCWFDGYRADSSFEVDLPIEGL
jgi:hypothetical protein